MKAKLGYNDKKTNLNGKEWSFMAKLIVDDTAVFRESERELQRVVDAFDSVYDRRVRD